MLKQADGFTIIEIMVAMAIFAIGILGVIKMQYTATLQNAQSRMNSEAVAVVSSYIEDLLQVDYTDIVSTSANTPDTRLTTSGIVCSIYRTVSLDVPIQDVKQIRIRIQWPVKGMNATKSFMTTYYVKNPEMTL